MAPAVEQLVGASALGGGQRLLRARGGRLRLRFLVAQRGAAAVQAHQHRAGGDHGPALDRRRDHLAIGVGGDVGPAVRRQRSGQHQRAGDRLLRDHRGRDRHGRLRGGGRGGQLALGGAGARTSGGARQRQRDERDQRDERNKAGRFHDGVSDVLATTILVTPGSDCTRRASGRVAKTRAYKEKRSASARPSDPDRCPRLRQLSVSRGVSGQAQNAKRRMM